MSFRKDLKLLLVQVAAKHGRVIGIDHMNLRSGQFSVEEVELAAEVAHAAVTDVERCTITPTTLTTHGEYASTDYPALIVEVGVQHSRFSSVTVQYDGTMSDLLAQAVE
jgi:hypothetical protein